MPIENLSDLKDAASAIDAAFKTIQQNADALTKACPLLGGAVPADYSHRHGILEFEASVNALVGQYGQVGGLVRDLAQRAAALPDISEPEEPEPEQSEPVVPALPNGEESEQ